MWSANSRIVSPPRTSLTVKPDCLVFFRFGVFGVSKIPRVWGWWKMFQRVKYLAEEVIIHPNHHLTRWLDPWRVLVSGICCSHCISRTPGISFWDPGVFVLTSRMKAIWGVAEGLLSLFHHASHIRFFPDSHVSYLTAYFPMDFPMDLANACGSYLCKSYMNEATSPRLA